MMISFPKVHQLLDLIYEVLIIESQVILYFYYSVGAIHSLLHATAQASLFYSQEIV